jgi:hypothetical protein
MQAHTTTATFTEARQIPLPMAAPQPRVRTDSLPEFTRYRDDGCSVSASCLDGPLPRCRYEEPGGLRALMNEHRDRQILDLRARGVSVEELADRFGVSRRTIFRVISAAMRPAPRRKKQEDFEPIPIRPLRSGASFEREANCA